MSTAIDARSVKQLRDATGLGMMDCKTALSETGGDFEKAVDWLRKKGIAKGDKLASRAAAEGAIGSYVHSNGKIGVLLELRCETDFSARNDAFATLVQDLCLHIAGSPYPPLAVSREDISAELIEKERQIYSASDDVLSKPEGVRDKIVQGRIDKFCKERALLDQPFVKNDKVSVADRISETRHQIGENIQVARFVRFELGA